MKNISLELFHNAELLTIFLAISIIVTILLVIYKRKKINTTMLILLSIICIYAFISLHRIGSNKLPETFWQPTSDEEYIILNVENDNEYDSIQAISGLGDTNNNVNNEYQIWFYNIDVYGSNDLNDWIHLGTIPHDTNGFYKWVTVEIEQSSFDYIMIVSRNSNAVINEFALRSTLGELIPLSIHSVSNPDNPYIPNNVIDEQDHVPTHVTYFDETYFDEVYHPRNAYEISQNQYLYPHVHPLLGTSIIAMGINLFGMNPFGFRIMGALAGIAMLPIMYLLVKKLLKNEKYALMATALFSVEFMHITTSRIGTLEPFSILSIMIMYYFMIDYIQTDFFKTNLSTLLKKLLFAGTTMGIAWAIKWTGIYASVGLALIFFYSIYKNYSLSKSKKMLFNDFIYKYKRIIPMCILFFILIPIIIYFVTYIPLEIYREPYTSFQDFIIKIYEYTIGIFNYHSTVDATHPFESSWWEWILNIRPIWYYSGFVEEVKHTIVCFNNPAISWLGIFGVLFALYRSIRYKDNVAIIIFLGYFTSIAPSIFVGRILFIYHYYPSVPFLIISIVYLFKHIMDRTSKYNFLIYTYIFICILLFIMFLPAITGFGTTTEYVDNILRWFPSWYF